jgi:two-component system, NtrC family, response regulator AlgB
MVLLPMNSDLQAPRQTSISVVLLDAKLGQENALKALDELHQLAPSPAVVIIKAYASIEAAVEAIQQGLFDYLPEPCTPEQLWPLLDRILCTRRLERRVLELESQLQSQAPDLELASDAPAMQKMLEAAYQAAATDAPVLVVGESSRQKRAGPSDAPT